MARIVSAVVSGVAAGFGLDGEHESLASAAVDGAHRLEGEDEVGEGRFGVFAEGLVAQGRSGDAAARDVLRHEQGEGEGGVGGVLDASRVAPSGPVDLFFHGGIVERAVREGVHRERGEAVLGADGAQAAARLGRGDERGGGGRAEAQADAEGVRGVLGAKLAEARGDARGVDFEVPGLVLQRFARMDVHAVGEHGPGSRGAD